MTTDLQKMYEFIENSTYIQNINNGRVQVKEYFGATSQAGMAYPRETLYNGNTEKKSYNTFHADMTKSQSHYMNPQQAKVI
jgi:hypothetical protein|tara:strand:+ start:540 stop:782 length:243 start_codon:yes stop_codon:yes gene_type:complete